MDCSISFPSFLPCHLICGSPRRLRFISLCCSRRRDRPTDRRSANRHRLLARGSDLAFSAIGVAASSKFSSLDARPAEISWNETHAFSILTLRLHAQPVAPSHGCIPIYARPRRPPLSYQLSLVTRGEISSCVSLRWRARARTHTRIRVRTQRRGTHGWRSYHIIFPVVWKAGRGTRASLTRARHRPLLRAADAM